MVKRKLQINCLKTLAILLIAGLFASGIACADEELTAEELLTQCKNKYAYAEDLWELGRYDEIKTLYQYISENCPDSDLVMKSQIWTAGCDIHLGNYSAADKMIETVKNKYSQQENLCAELDSLCDEYWIMQKYDKAKALFAAEPLDVANQLDRDPNVLEQRLVKGRNHLGHCDGLGFAFRLGLPLRLRFWLRFWLRIGTAFRGIRLLHPRQHGFVHMFLRPHARRNLAFGVRN